MQENLGTVWKTVALGALGGLLWGIGMRAWMRFISFDPEFSWSGTLFIIGATTLAGVATGLAHHRWRHVGSGGVSLVSSSFPWAWPRDQ